MPKAGIAIDKYKLPVFERRLREAGFTFKQGPGLTKDTLFLTVETDEILGLKTVIEAANAEATK